MSRFSFIDWMSEKQPAVEPCPPHEWVEVDLEYQKWNPADPAILRCLKRGCGERWPDRPK